MVYSSRRATTLIIRETLSVLCENGNKKNELKVLKYVASSIREASDISEMLGSRLRLHV